MSAVLQFTLKAKDEASRVVTDATKNISGDMRGLETAIGNVGRVAGPTFIQLKSGIAAAATAAGVIGGAAVAAGTAIFSLAKSAADAGSKFHDLSIQTGLSVETLSGLDLQLTQSGTSVDALARAVVLMQRNLGEAAGGSKELQQAFAALGVKDARAALADTDGTLRTLARSLANAGEAGEVNAAGAKVMGRGFKELSVFLQETNGDLDAVIEASRKAGRVMSDDAADAADAFGDQLDALSNAASIAGRTIGMEAIPQITGAMRDLTGATEGNISTLRSWGQTLGEVVKMARFYAGAISEFSFADTGRSYLEKLERLADRIDREDKIAAGKLFDLNAPVTPEQKAAGAAERARALAAIGIRAAGAGDDIFSPPAKAKREKDRKDELDKLKAFAKEWEFVVTSTVGGRHNKGSLHPLGRAMDVSVKGKSDEEIRAFIDAALKAGYGVRDERVRPPGQKVWGGPHLHLETQSKAVRAAVEAESKVFDEQADILKNLSRAIADADLQLKGLTRSSVEQQIAAEYQQLGIGKLTGAAAELGEALFAERAEQIRAAEAAERHAQALKDLLELAGRFAEVDPASLVPGLPIPQGKGQEKGPWVDPSTFEAEFGQPPDFSPWETAISSLKDLAVTSFKDIGVAMGQSAAAAFAYGKSFGKAMWQATQAALASIASLAFVEAIKETALGFAKLAGFLPGPAALHFKAAGLWALAGVAAGGAAAAIGSAGGAGATAGGSAFTSNGTTTKEDRDRTIREPRYGGAPDPDRPQLYGEVAVKLEYPDGHMETQMVRIYERRSAFRGLVRSDMLGEPQAG